MSFDKRRHTEFENQCVQFFERLLRKRSNDEEHEIRSCSAGFEHLVWVPDKVFAKNRNLDMSSNASEIIKRSLKFSLLGEHTDGARAARFIAQRELVRFRNRCEIS